MKSILKIVAAALALAGSAFAGTVTITTPTAWPKTDVPADPTITFGTLPNGMRYLIKPNTHPEHGVSFFLRIANGSFNEAPEEAGWSHFIEHMVFRGTTHIPDGEIFKRLEKIGLGLGTDSNAFTYPDSTVFTFDFPKNDADTVDTALTVVREIASEVTFDPKTVDSERQVVLSENRLHDTGQMRLSRASHKALYGERLAEGYVPGGTKETITAATADGLKAYYRAHYRPDRSVLIVVGDIDAKAIETAIKARFGDWKATGPSPAAPRFETPDPPKEPAFHVFVEKSANTAIEFAWVSPYDPTPETKAREIRDGVREIALRILNLRLHKLATSANPPFLNARVAASNSYRAAFVASVGASVGSGDAKRAMISLRQTLATALRDGVTQDEVDRAIAQLRTLASTSVTAAPSRTNGRLTGRFSAAIGSGDVLDAPENWTWAVEATAKDLTAARVSDELRSLFGRGAPHVIITSPVQPDTDALTAAYRETGPADPASAAASTAPVVWPYTDFGPAGTVASRKEIADLGVTVVQLANGVRAIIKPTKYLEGQAAILVRVGHGRIGLRKDKAAPAWAISGAWALGGIKRIATSDLQQALNGKQWGATPDLAEGGFQLTGQTRIADIETELQLMAAYITDPAWRPEGLAQLKTASETGLRQSLATPGGVYGLNYWEYLHNNDKRWAPPTLEDVKTVDLDSVKHLIVPELNDGPMEVIVVGDVALDDVVDKLTRTLGALPKRKVETKPLAAHEEMPKTGGAPLIVRHNGSSQEAVAMLGWKTTSLFPDPQTSRIIRVLESAMRLRLFDELRTKEGITYSPQTTLATSWTTPGWGALTMTATVPAPKLGDFYAAAKRVAADLASKELTEDEFERARGPLVTEAEHAAESNGYWLHALAGIETEPRALGLIRERVSGVKAVTAADVLRVAKEYLKDERTLRMIVVPEGFAVPPELNAP